MAQTYQDDCFNPNNVAQSDLQAIENNFAALKSQFSGTGAPSNTVAGMPWIDLTRHMLCVRNEANNAWLDIFNLATGQAQGVPVMTVATLAEVKAAEATKAVVGNTLLGLLSGVSLNISVTKSTPGEWSHTVSDRTRHVSVVVEGAGGGGGGGYFVYYGDDPHNFSGGTGGAGGSTAEYYTITPGATLSGTIATGGTGNAASGASGGPASGATTCSQTGQTANGGAGGGGASSGGNGSTGNHGTAAGGDTNTAGGMVNGGGGGTGYWQIGGGGTTPSGAGGNGSVTITEFF